MNKDLSMQVVDLRTRLRCCNGSDDDGSCDSSGSSADADGAAGRSLDLSRAAYNSNVRTIDACIAAADQVSQSIETTNNPTCTRRIYV